MELDITNVAHGGVFVARHGGRVVFVGDTIPGERVRARLTEARHDSFWRAEAIEVLEASPYRREHVWAAASIDRAPGERAGGAEFGHIELQHQRELKSRVIADALGRMAHLELAPAVQAVPIVDPSPTLAHAATASTPAADDGLGWRTRVRLQVAQDGTVGPYAARSHRVVRVEDLPLATPLVAAAAPLRGRFEGASSVDVVGPSIGGEIVLVNERRNQRGRAATRSAPHAIRERVGEREFRLDARGFWQVHSAAPAALTRAVQQAVDADLFDPDAANLDLYGGVGLLAAALGDRFGPSTRITSVESAATATEFAAGNLAGWVGASAITDRVDRFVARSVAQASAHERARQRAATVVLDPPRSGAGRDVVDGLLALSPAQLVYVACDPIAFARDAAFFAAGGYTVRALRAFDLFPHTHHVELVALLTR
ncbi:MAG: class I SAM-dependent RNA methyltransferase [Microbacteriaceae bacterium]|nr:MAG: class I SAM-dependent RNA methyltransferase [Microbacteriaceae bacterium]